MTLLKERLKKARLENGMSVDEVVDLLSKNGVKITGRSIFSYEMGERQPSMIYVESLIKYLNINPGWLFTDKGEIFANDINVQNTPANVDLSKMVFIPLLDARLSAGYGAILQGRECIEDFVAFASKWLSRITLTNPNNLLAFTVSGDSMEGDIHDGDLVIINTLSNELQNDGVYAICIDDRFYVKILQRIPGNKVLVISKNESYRSFEVDLKSKYFKIIGRVIWSGGRKDI